MGLRTKQSRRGDQDRGAFHAGRAARDRQWGIDANPYKRGTVQHREWSRGWRYADRNKQSGD